VDLEAHCQLCQSLEEGLAELSLLLLSLSAVQVETMAGEDQSPSAAAAEALVA